MFKAEWVCLYHSMKRYHYRRHLKNKRNNLFSLGVASFVSLIFLSLTPWFINYQASFKKVAQTVNKEKKVVFNKSVFEGAVIEGKAFIVYDLKENEIIASKNENTQFPLASLTKIMTAITAKSLVTKDKEEVIVSRENIDEGLDFGLRLGDAWNLEEFLKYMLVFSSNDAARLVAVHFGGNSFFLEKMNTKAKEYSETLSFGDPAGLDEYGVLGGRGTPLDVVFLFREAVRLFPEILDATTKTRFTAFVDDEKISGIPNTNQSVENFFGLEASKTGFTPLAGGNLGVVVDITLGRPVVIIVLGSTRDGRFKDVSTLYTLLKKSLE